MSRPKISSWQQWLLIGMMLINLAVLGGLIGRLSYSQTHQIKVVNAVLKDYSAMAGQQLVRLLKGQIGYNALHDLTQLWFSPDDPTPSIIAYLNQSDSSLTPVRQQVRNGIKAISVLNQQQHSVRPIKHERLDTIANELIAHEPAGEQTSFMVIHDPTALNLNFHAVLTINDKFSVICEFDDPLIRTAIQSIINQRPLLPEVLNPLPQNLGLSFVLKNPTGETVWQTHDNVQNQQADVINIGDDYGGLFNEFELIAGMDQHLADKLIIGSLPESQVSSLWSLIGVAASAMLIMFWLYHRATSLNNLREQFMARASHELKTPLTQIRLCAETITLDRHGDEKNHRNYVNIIHRESIRLSQLVENILHHQQLKQTNFSPAWQTIDLKQFIAGIIKQQSLLWQPNQIQIKLDVEDQITIDTDPNFLTQVLLNLLDNAVKYGPENQLIRIHGRIQNNTVSLKIIDQGPGIPAHKQQWVLENYHRLERDEQRGINGNGLGLCIAAELLKQLGGKLLFENQAKGTCVLIVLPQTQNHEENHYPD